MYMATSSLNSSLSEELMCPVCFEEFVHPKCLPLCAHNVCKACLEKIVSKRAECPICRECFAVPQGGVDAIPTNTLLVRLVERVKPATPNLTDQKIQKLVEVATNFQLDARRKGDEIKKTIRDETNAFTAAIRKRELKLCSEVDDFVQAYEKEVSLYQVQRTGENLNRKASEKLNNEEIESLLPKIQDLDLNSSDDALAKTIGIPEFNLQFELNYSYCAKFVKRFGSLKAASGDAKQLRLSDSSTGTAENIPAKVQVIKTITSTDLGDTLFTPYAVTVSGDRIGILDDELNRVHVLTHKGNHLSSFTIKYGDLYDLTFVGNVSIYVVNRSHKSIIRYFLDGRYQSPDIKSPPAIRFNSNASFTSISTMKSAKKADWLLVSVETLSDSRILICDVQGNWLNSFGHGDLQCPRKALWHNEEYFVCDRDLGCVKVFNSEGSFVREFGDGLDSPRGLAIDEGKNNVLVSDPGSNTVHVYGVEGVLLTTLEMEAPVSVAMLKDGNAIACFHDELCCAQILSYTTT